MKTQTASVASKNDTRHIQVPKSTKYAPSHPSLAGSGTSEKTDSPKATDAPVASTLTPATCATLSVLKGVQPHQASSISDWLSHLSAEFVIDQHGNAFVIGRDTGNPRLLRVGSSELNAHIRALFLPNGKTLSKKQMEEINEALSAKAELEGTRTHAWTRVAPLPDNGIEIDLGDESHTRICITAGNVGIVKSGSETLFIRSRASMPMTISAEGSNYKLLHKYINLSNQDFILLVAWITYTIAHPKVASSNYVILVLQGGQGSGKSFSSKVIIRVVDPSQIGVQRLPSNEKDLGIAAQSAHLLAYDNMRNISVAMSDALCTAATGGSTASRKLYTNDDQQILNLHVAMVFNGIHSFVEQPDLAQRCLTLHLKRMPESHRKSETDMMKEFETDLPTIQRGLFDLIAQIFKYLPVAVVTAPTRMIDFSRWLSAMERVFGIPSGTCTFEDLYVSAITEGQL